MRVPDYVLTEEVIIYKNGAQITLVPGTFVKPMDERYVPKSIKEAEYWFNSRTHTFAYCSAGIVSIPHRLIRVI